MPIVCITVDVPMLYKVQIMEFSLMGFFMDSVWLCLHLHTVKNAIADENGKRSSHRRNMRST